MLKFALGLITLAVLSSGVALWQTEIPTPKPTVQSTEDNWQLPTLSQATQIQQTYIKLRRLKPWGYDEKKKRTASTKTKKKPNTKKPRPDWRFAGIVQRGYKRYILFLDKFNKVTQYGLQSSLPNGERLVRIHNDFIEVLQEGKLKKIRLYSQ